MTVYYPVGENSHEQGENSTKADQLPDWLMKRAILAHVLHVRPCWISGITPVLLT